MPKPPNRFSISACEFFSINPIFNLESKLPVAGAKHNHTRQKRSNSWNPKGSPTKSPRISSLITGKSSFKALSLPKAHKIQKSPFVNQQNSFEAPVPRLNPVRPKEIVSPGLSPKLSPIPKGKLPPQVGKKKKTLVLDLDDTLIHSSFDKSSPHDFSIRTVLEGVLCFVYVAVRPYAYQLLQSLAKYYEIVIFTASVPHYAKPIVKALDKTKAISYILCREDCTIRRGDVIKDLSSLGRRMNSLIIVEDSPRSYMLSPENAVAVSPWPHGILSRGKDPSEDSELKELISILSSDYMINCSDTREGLKHAAKLLAKRAKRI